MRRRLGPVPLLFVVSAFLFYGIRGFEVGRILTVEAEIGKNYTNRTGAELIVYQYSVEQNKVIRINIASNDATRSVPLLAVFREPATIVSVQLPVVISGNIYNTTARTLCPVSLSSVPSPDRKVPISVELSSFSPVDFTFSARLVDNFVLKLDDEPLPVSASVSQPVFFQYNFPHDVDSVVIFVDSSSTACMAVSIQKAECPVFDEDNNMISGGMHQTMTKSGSITVERRFFDKFFVVFSVRPNDDECADVVELTKIIPPHPKYTAPRKKFFNITLNRTPNTLDYLMPIALTTGAIAGIYVLAIIFTVLMAHYERKQFELERTELQNALLLNAELSSEESISDDDEDEPTTSQRPLSATGSVASYDLLPDSRDMHIVRQNLHLTVADLSLKTWKERDKKYHRYVVSMITISIFYCLPVVQLVMTWQDTVRLSGDQDLCWYNFRCARPFFVFYAFNNVFSNCGYVFLGLLFLMMVKEREIRHRAMWRHFPRQLKNEYGLPQHNGLMYALGIAVVMEGVLSASYHICPSSSNYQFDTSFMYVIGMLGMLKVYQLRHPDINANAHVAFGFVAFSILVAMLGVYLNSFPFWILFSISYFFTMIVVSVEFYFKGMWRFRPMEIVRAIQYTFYSSRRCSCIVPTHVGRMIFLLLGNAINFTVIILGLTRMPKDFPSFLLFPFIANLFLYLLYYVVMKLIHREKLRAKAIAFLVLSFLCWSAAGWFFIHNVSDWSVTPASSRERNHDCILLDFYDNHDVWHFLSSIGIFMSFSLLNCIDDDLQWVRRDKIAVF